MIVKKSSAVLIVTAVAVVFYLLGSFVGLPFVDKTLASGDVSVAADGDDDLAYLHSEKLKEAVITGKLPKKLNTFTPFWGVPQPGSGLQETPSFMEDCYYYRPDGSVYPKWVTWNLDLASRAQQRYKFEQFIPDYESLPCDKILREAVDECYRWAWRKPYGNTNVVMGPLFNPKDSEKPYAYFVTVCKKERLDVPLPLGYSSMAYMIPVNATDKNIDEYALTVNAIESHSGYDLFHKLPAAVQNEVEEITNYELFFQDINSNDEEALQPEMELPEKTDDPIHDR